MATFIIVGTCSILLLFFNAVEKKMERIKKYFTNVLCWLGSFCELGFLEGICPTFIFVKTYISLVTNPNIKSKSGKRLLLENINVHIYNLIKHIQTFLFPSIYYYGT